MDTTANTPDEQKDTIINYINESSGLSIINEIDGQVQLQQKLDKNTLALDFELMDQVLTRFDEKGDKFLQVNFKNKSKIFSD